ncbi:hypothetical protein THIOKS11320024 [Thiocapsa sp. KS1]|nr:hypothetical protein THIOKS11320024 [Thiocapsa sp. KS1]
MPEALRLAEHTTHKAGQTRQEQIDGPLGA